MSAELIIGIASLVAGILIGRQSNKIAGRDLKLAEAEHEHRQRERQSRAKLDVAIDCVNMARLADGRYATEGSQAFVRLEITVTNTGDRNAGRGTVEVDAPMSISDLYLRWSDAGGRELPERTERGARVDGGNMLPGPLAGVSRDFPEVLYVTMSTAVPGEYSIQVRVRAEHADPVSADFDLRIVQRSAGAVAGLLASQGR